MFLDKWMENRRLAKEREALVDRIKTEDAVVVVGLLSDALLQQTFKNFSLDRSESVRFTTRSRNVDILTQRLKTAVYVLEIGSEVGLDANNNLEPTVLSLDSFLVTVDRLPLRPTEVLPVLSPFVSAFVKSMETHRLSGAASKHFYYRQRYDLLLQDLLGFQRSLMSASDVPLDLS